MTHLEIGGPRFIFYLTVNEGGKRGVVFTFWVNRGSKRQLQWFMYTAIKWRGVWRRWWKEV